MNQFSYLEAPVVPVVLESQAGPLVQVVLDLAVLVVREVLFLLFYTSKYIKNVHFTTRRYAIR